MGERKRKLLKPVGLLALFCLSAFSEATVIRHPIWKSRNTCLFRVDSVEVLPEVTRVYLACQGGRVRWAEVSPDVYLTDGETFKLRVTDMDGADPGRRFLLPDTGTLSLTLYFPGLPDSVRKTDLRQEGKDSWMIRGIVLTEKNEESLIPARFRGNWLETGAGNRWILGLWDEVAIWKEECWDYSLVEEREGTLFVGLEKGEKREKLQLQLLPDGGFLLYAEDHKPVAVSVTSDYNAFSDPVRNPTIPPLPSDSPDSTVLRGYLKGYDPLFEMDSATIYWDNVVTGETRIVPVRITPRGTFEIRLMAWYPVQQTLFFKKGHLNFYLEPGRTLMVFADVEELVASAGAGLRGERKVPGVRYMGSLERINRELKIYRSQPHVSISFSPHEKPDPAGYEKLSREGLEKEKTCLERFIAEYKISEQSAQLLRLDLGFARACRLLDYEQYYVYRGKEDAATFFPPDYYGFLKDLPDSGILALSVACYKLFIDRLEKCRPVMACREWSAESMLQGFHREGYPLSEPDAELVRFALALRSWSDTLTFRNYSSRMRVFNEKYGPLQKLVREKIWIDKVREVLWPDTRMPLPLHCRLLFTRRFASRMRYLKNSLTEQENRLYKEAIGDKWLNRVVWKETARYLP